MRYALLLLLAMHFAWPLSASGQACLGEEHYFVTDRTSIGFEYTEPTENVDGSILDDLEYVEVYIKFRGALLFMRKIPATSPFGGGDVATAVQVPIHDGAVEEINVFMTGVKYNGARSRYGCILTVLIDRSE